MAKRLHCNSQSHLSDLASRWQVDAGGEQARHSHENVLEGMIVLNFVVLGCDFHGDLMFTQMFYGGGAGWGLILIAFLTTALLMKHSVPVPGANPSGLPPKIAAIIPLMHDFLLTVVLILGGFVPHVYNSYRQPIAFSVRLLRTLQIILLQKYPMQGTMSISPLDYRFAPPAKFWCLQHSWLSLLTLLRLTPHVRCPSPDWVNISTWHSMLMSGMACVEPISDMGSLHFWTLILVWDCSLSTRCNALCLVSRVAITNLDGLAGFRKMSWAGLCNCSGSV